METPQKQVVSAEWTNAERAAVASAIEADIRTSVQEEAKLRETIKWEAPCFAEIERKKVDMRQLLEFVLNMPADFLVLNKANFGRYVEV